MSLRLYWAMEHLFNLMQPQNFHISSLVLQGNV